MGSVLSLDSSVNDPIKSVKFFVNSKKTVSLTDFDKSFISSADNFAVRPSLYACVADVAIKSTINAVDAAAC